MKTEKVFWIGDDGDNKSVSIARKIYGRGDEIPAHDVASDLLDEWRQKGLISVGEKNAPIVIRDTKAVKNLKAEVRSLTAKLDDKAALENENIRLSKALEKANTGKKATRLKDLETDNQEKAALIEKQQKDMADLMIDNQEKAALIEKQQEDIKVLNAPPGGEK